MGILSCAGLDILKGDLLVGAHALDGIFFFVVTAKPDFAIRVVISQSLKEGRGAVVVYVDCAHNIGHWVTGVPDE